MTTWVPQSCTLPTTEQPLRVAEFDTLFAERLADASRSDRRGRALAPHPLLDPLEGPGLRGKRTRIIGPYTQPPDGATVICADELGPVIPRTFAPAPGWSPDGHRIKSEIDYSRGPGKTWVYVGLRVRDGQQITMAASSRNSVFYVFAVQAGGGRP
ncbi:hypothetical protein ACIBAH_32705 [Streptomyces sp. NPDC051445]|uniref:hypothetical protein n=1 Tax=Streptomyces sp. NPDC051445 TaxID=3365653 RepID=UPI0037893271